jgi:hypothetical protein
MRADGILEKAVARIDKMEQVVVGTFGACKSMVSACLADWLPTSFCYEEPGNYSRTGEDQTCCQKSKEETLMSEAANVSDSQKPLGVADEKHKEKNRRKETTLTTRRQAIRQTFNGNHFLCFSLIYFFCQFI